MFSIEELTSLTDSELVKEYQLGNEKAFEILLRRCKNRVFTGILVFVRDRQIAEDIFQETFIKVIDELRKGNYNEEGKFLGWVVRISKNICLDRYRKTKRIARHIDSEEKNVVVKLKLQEGDAEEQFIKSETRIDLKELINQLPCRQKEILILRHYANLSFKEISNLTGINMNTCLGLMSRAIIGLKKMKEGKVVLA